MRTSPPCRLMLTVFAVGSLLLRAAAGAEPSVPFSLDAIQRIDVPEDRLTDRPFRDQIWVPLDREDFERLLSQIAPRPPGPQQSALQQVRYSAALAGDTLVSGRLQAELQEVAGTSNFLPLGEPSLAIEELSWSSGPARWGTAPDGRQWLKREAGQHALEGRWTSRGRSLLSGVSFDLKLLPASVSQLELLTPRGHVVTSDVGDVESVVHADDGEALRWRIDLGSQSRCRLMVSRLETPAAKAPTVLYEQELAVAVSNEELLLRQVFLAEVLAGEIDRLTVSFPRQIEIVSVAYGDQPALKYERIPGEGPAAQMVVWLPESVQGRTRPIRLEGFLRRATSESLAVPQFQLEGGLWLHGRVNVSVARPWELRSYRATGYHQSSPASLRTDAETISFQQLTPRAQLLLNVERPAVERTAHALNLLTATESIWTLTAEIAWESRSGTVYDASCRLPAGWQVVSVVQLGGDRELQEIAGWDVQSHPESGQLLRMEFSEGLTPGRVDPVRIIAHRNALAAPLTHVPVIVPADCESTEVLLTVDAQAHGNLTLSSNLAFEPFDPQAAAAVWNTLPSWSAVQRSAPESRRLFHLTTPETAIPVPPEETAAVQDALVQVSVRVSDQQMDEEFEIRLQLAAIQAELEVYAPRDAAGITWTMNDGAEQTLIARRSARAPSPRGGESWILTFPEPYSGAVTLLGRRTIPRTADYSVPLLFVPRARRFQGRVLLSSESSETYQLRETPLRGSAIVAPSASSVDDLTSVPREWSYQQDDREWLVQPRHHSLADGSPVPFRLSSILAVDAADDDYHELRLSSDELFSATEFQFQLDAPARLIAVLQAGRPLPYTMSGVEVTVTGWEPDVAGEVAILYRVPAARRWCGSEHALVWPRLPMPCAECVWDVSLPSGMDLSGEPLGMHFTPRPSRPGWFQRVFGPFSRLPGEALFPAAKSWQDPTGSPPLQRLTAPLESQTHATSGLQFPVDRPVSHATRYGLPTFTTFVVWDRDALRQATWAALIGCFPLGLLFRRGRGTWQNRLTAVVIGVFACLAVFGPDGWNVVCGGGSSGLLLACLVPRRTRSRWSDSPAGTASQTMSTQVFHKAAPLLWIVCACCQTLSDAQEPAKATAAENNVAVKAEQKPNYQVLVPVDRQQKPSRTLPVVYVSPALHEQLMALNTGPATEPSQLIGSAEYIIHWDQNRRPSLKIKYQIDIWPKKDHAQLIVPIGRRWASALESCTVDGRRQSAILSPDSRTLALPLDPGSTETDSEHAVSHEVVLEIHLPPSFEALEGEFEADVLPVLNSRLIWQSSEALQWFDVPEALGAVTVSLDRRLVEAQLGAVEAWRFSRTKGDRPSHSDGATEVQLLQLLTLHPTLTQGAFRAECRVLTEGPDRWELELPAGAVLREIRGHKILQTTILAEAGQASRVILEFQEPQRQNFVVEGEYILPHSVLDQNIDLPRCIVRCGKPAAAQRNLVAVACEAGFSTQMINVDDPAVLPIPIEQFVTQWGDTVPNQLPRFAFQVQDGGQPSFRLAAVPSEQQLLNWREDVTISSRRLDWILAAELKSSSPSVYSYTVLLDRRISIEQVSLRENGTDQLLKWSKTPMIGSGQNRLTLFLNRESTGVSQLRIQGSLRVRPSSPISLPSVRFETAQTVPGTLTLYHEAGHRLELEGRQLPAEGAGSFPDLLSDPIPNKFFKRMKIQEGDSGLTARLEPAAGACRAQSLWEITPSTSNWTIRGRMDLSPQEGTREIRVVVPNWLSEARLELLQDGPPPFEQWEDGQRLLQIRCDADPEATRVLLWNAEIPAPKETTLRLKLPTALHAVQSSDFAACNPAPEWGLDPEPTVPIHTLPEALRDQFSQWNRNGVELLSRLADNVLAVRRVDQQSTDGLSSVMLVEHQLQGTPDGGWQGQSDFHPSAAAGTVEILVPEGLTIVSVTADGQTLSADHVSAADRSWRIQNAGQYLTLGVRWQAAPQLWRLPVAGLSHVSLPHCMQERAPLTLLAMTPAEDSWLTVWRSPHRQERWEIALARLEWLLRRHQQQLDAHSPEPGLSKTIWHEYHAAAASLPVSNASAPMTEKNRLRWETITQAVKKIEDSPDRPPQSSSALVSPLPGDAPRTDFAVLPSDETVFRCGMIRRDAVNWLCAGALLAVGWWLLPVVIGLQFTPWLAEHRHAGWFVFGMFWWLCLSPSIAGFAVMAWAVLAGVWQRRLQVSVNH